MKLKDHFRDFIISNKITYGFLAKTFWAILLCRLIYFIFHSVHFIYLVKYNCHLKLKSKSIYVYIFLSLAKIISFGSFRVQMCVTIGDSEGTRIDLSVGEIRALEGRGRPAWETLFRGRRDEQMHMET